MTSAPDYFEPVVAWRMWYASESPAGFRLASVFHGAVWPVGEPLLATCCRARIAFIAWRRERHDAPAEQCECGIYAAPLAQLGAHLQAQRGARHLPIVGRVSLWGTVFECERGWRASAAYPETLYVPSLRGESIERVEHDLEAYGVPVERLHCTTVAAGLDELALAEAAA